MKQSELNKAYIIAAENGELEEVKKYLQEGAEVNAMGPNSAALHCAAGNGHLKVVEEILKQKQVDPNLQDKQSYYPLHIAASKGEVAICNRLIKAGADLEKTTEAGGTALHVAAASDQAKVVNALVAAGANLEAQDKEGNSPLSVAAGLGALSTVKALIKAKANLNSTNEHGDTPLIKAIRNMYVHRINNWSSTGHIGDIPVTYSVIKGCFLFDKGGDVKILSLKDQRYCASQNWGPNQHLTYLDAFDCIMALIKAGADHKPINKQGKTAMHLACHTGEARIIDALLKAKAPADKPDLQGATPLHYAAGAGRHDGLELLLKKVKFKNIDVEDEFGWTPLFYLADIGGTTSMAEQLLEAGADKNHKSTKERGQGMPSGMTAKDVALHWNDRAMAEVL
jgi:ankyrin repeat protein